MKCFVTGNSAVNVQCGARVKAPSSARPDSAALAACLWALSAPTRARTQHTVTTADGLRLGTQGTELPQGGNNRAWPLLGAVFYRKHCVETCQTIRRTWSYLAWVRYVFRTGSEILFMRGWHSLDHNQIWLELECQRYPCVASSGPHCNQAFHTPSETDLMYLHCIELTLRLIRYYVMLRLMFNAKKYF